MELYRIKLVIIEGSFVVSGVVKGEVFMLREKCNDCGIQDRCPGVKLCPFYWGSS